MTATRGIDMPDTVHYDGGSATDRRRILEVSQQVSALHVAPAFSCLEIVDLVFHGLMRRNAEGKGFRDGQPEILVQCRKHKDVCVAIRLPLRVIKDWPLDSDPG